MANAQADTDATGFDSAAAVTRSMLGWGVLAGPIYLVIGLTLALTRDGFNLAEHPLSLLMLGDHGWIQRVNLILSGVLCAVAAVGFYRTMNRYGTRNRLVPILLGGFALGLLGSGTFAPDPMSGFPSGAEPEATSSGLIHLAFGAFQFVCLAAACFAMGRWTAHRKDMVWSRYSYGTAIVILCGFGGGAVLAQSPIGVGLLWIAVIACYAWLAATSICLWRIVPHPDTHRRHPQP